MAAGDGFCRVRNLGAQTIEGRFDGDDFVIEADSEIMLPVEAAKMAFGDWDIRNVGREPELRWRDHEYARLRGRYGVHEGAKIPVGLGPDGNVVADENGVPKEILADTVYKNRLPRVSISLFDGTPVITVLEDPSGQTMPADTASAHGTAMTTMSQQKEIEALKAAIVELQQNQARAPVDSPETARPKPRPAKVTSSQNAGAD